MIDQTLALYLRLLPLAVSQLYANRKGDPTSTCFAAVCQEIATINMQKDNDSNVSATPSNCAVQPAQLRVSIPLREIASAVRKPYRDMLASVGQPCLVRALKSKLFSHDQKL